MSTGKDGARDPSGAPASRPPVGVKRTIEDLDVNDLVTWLRQATMTGYYGIAGGHTASSIEMFIRFARSQQEILNKLRDAVPILLREQRRPENPKGEEQLEALLFIADELGCAKAEFDVSRIFREELDRPELRALRVRCFNTLTSLAGPAIPESLFADLMADQDLAEIAYRALCRHGTERAVDHIVALVQTYKEKPHVIRRVLRPFFRSFRTEKERQHILRKMISEFEGTELRDAFIQGIEGVIELSKAAAARHAAAVARRPPIGMEGF